MDVRFARVLEVLDGVRAGPPADITAFLRDLPAVGSLPSPWETWALVGLVRHRERQLWVADVIRTRLRGDPGTLARAGSLGHPAGVPQSGPVPGHPGWEYFFHGIGCRLSHKVDGDRIDVDFHGDTAEYYDSFFYAHYLESLRRPESPEERLRELHPSSETVRLALVDLVAAGALTPLPGREAHPARVADEVLVHADGVGAFCRAWADPAARVWLGALVGDWPAAYAAAAGHAERERETASRAAECRERRAARLGAIDPADAAGRAALFGLADLGGPPLDRALEAAFRSGQHSALCAALDVVARRNDSRWCEHADAVRRTTHPAGAGRNEYLWMKCVTYLFRHRPTDAALTADLPHAGGGQIGVALVLALEHAPQHALALVRKATRSPAPCDRTAVAAILALLRQPWATAELLAALSLSTDQHQTIDARAALLELGDLAAERAVRAWDERNPHEPEAPSFLEVNGERPGPFYSFGEIDLQNRAARLRYEMDRWRERVERVRHVVPPDPPRPWWQFW